jgi:hypothetical protein
VAGNDARYIHLETYMKSHEVMLPLGQTATVVESNSKWTVYFPDGNKHTLFSYVAMVKYLNKKKRELATMRDLTLARKGVLHNVRRIDHVDLFEGMDDM